MREPASIVRELEINRNSFQSLLAEIPEAQHLWKPARDKWCLLEVVCHLYDEEREDFRTRTKHVLEGRDQPLPSIDPVGWVTERKYLEQDFERMTLKFLAERKASADWLRSLESPKWDNVFQHSKFGAQSARMFLHNWLAHDYFHFRQFTRLKYAYLQTEGGQPLDYAGTW